ncbi:MAG TPA: MucB/RseB C-terminal domain-containing protein, partial [Plasticicumulans sp.]|nr:MucB/RseB C-terminal domain-containing protein [Plasticicumulans sp.]
LQAAGAGDPGSGETPVSTVAEVAPVAQWSLASPPAGFEQVQHNRFQRQSDGRPTEHVVYSDGLATISLFIERVTPGRSLLEGPSRIGAMNAWGKVVDGIQAVVVGEVPAATVAAFAQGLKFAPAPVTSTATTAGTADKTAETKP